MPIDEALNPLFATSHQNQQKADCCLASSYACRWRALLFFSQINGTERKWRKGFARSREVGTLQHKLHLVYTAVKQHFAGVVPQSKSSSQMKGVPCFPAGSLLPSVRTNKASKTARLLS